MKYQLVIFDWDGTVMDSAAKIVHCMQQAALDCDLAVPSREAVEHIIGISLVPAIGQLFDLQDSALIDKIVERYKYNYLNSDQTPCPLFPGILPLFDMLSAQPRTLAVATGKARRGLNRAWQQTVTGHYFSHSRCADEAESKPSPDMLSQLLAETGIDVERSLMIGDTSYDMQMAQSLGMDRVAVNYGVHEESVLRQYDPKIIAESVAELHQFLLHH